MKELYLSILLGISIFHFSQAQMAIEPADEPGLGGNDGVVLGDLISVKPGKTPGTYIITCSNNPKKTCSNKDENLIWHIDMYSPENNNFIFGYLESAEIYVRKGKEIKKIDK
jgi:hypothetical protein